MPIYTPPRIISFVDGPCTSGKTHAFIEHVTDHHKKRSRRNFLLAVPTMQLAAQVEADFKKRGVPVTRIDSDTHPGRVSTEVVGFLAAKKHRGTVLLITHATRFDMPYFHDRWNWSVFIDEVPETLKFKDPMLPRTWHLLGEYVEVTEVVGKRLGRLKPKDQGRLRRYLAQPLDDGEKDVREILADVANPHWMVFVDLASWGRLTELHKVSRKDENRNRIYFVSILSPDAIAGTTIMSADIRSSLLWHWMLKNGCQWVEKKEIYERLRFRQYPEELGRRVHVQFVWDHEDKVKWSKRARDTADVLQRMDDLGEMWADGKPTLVIQNKDSKSRLPSLSNFQRISTHCHGLNAYQDYTQLVFNAALNFEGKLRGMLKDLGFSEQVQRDSLVQSALHQGVMRTALRDLKSDAQVEVLVPDQDMADAVARSLGGAWISDVGGAHEPRFRTAVASQESLQRERDLEDEGVEDSYTPSFEVPHATTATPSPTAPQGQKHVLALTFNKLDPWPCAFEQVRTDLRGFKKLLKGSLKRVRTDKHGDRLLQLTEFNPNVEKTTGYLCERNFIASHGITLDFDGGTCTHKEFERIFWKEAGKLTKIAFITCNTFSTAPGVNKFRVFVIFRRPTTSIEQYQAIYDWFEKRLAEEGHLSKTSGLDRNSRSAVQQYYLPCTNAAHPLSAFMMMRGLSQMREFETYALNPEAISPAPREERHWMTTPDGDRSEMSDIILEEAEELKAEIEEMTEGRRSEVFKLVRKYRAAGQSFYEIEDDLVHWAPDANVERHVLGAIESLRSYEGNGSQPRRRTEPSPAKPTFEAVNLDDYAGPNYMPELDAEAPIEGHDEDDWDWFDEQVALGKIRLTQKRLNFRMNCYMGSAGGY